MKAYFVFFVFLQCVAFGGFERAEVGARASAFGGAFCGLSDDCWAIFFNVGGLSQVQRREVSFFYSPQPFGLKELSTSAAAAAYSTNFGVIGISARRYGFNLYREFSGSLAYAKTISDVGIGINVNYHSVAIKNYGAAGTIGIDVGILLHIIDKLRWGISVKNINAPTIGTSKEKLPQTFSSGVAYIPLENLHLFFDYQKELRFEASPRFGFEYWIIDAFALRGGVSDQPVQYSGGMGIRYAMFQVDYAFAMHQELGSTHEASFTIRWGGGYE
jgi:hypothetical protein